jgi:hypothetical protein
MRLQILTYADFTCQDQWREQMNSFIATIKKARQNGNCPDSSPAITERDHESEILFSLSFEGEAERLTLKDLQQIQALLQRYAKDINLRIQRMGMGSVILEITSTREGYYRLCRLLQLGELSKLMGREIIGLSSIVEGKQNIIKRLDSDSKEIIIPTDCELKPNVSCVCRRNRIEGFDEEYRTAIRLLPPQTNSLSEVAVYVTAHEEYYYIHSNYTTHGFSYTTKIACDNISDSTVVFCHCWRQCDTLRPYPILWMKGQLAHAASHRRSRSHCDRPRGHFSRSL